jgi:hypothetical protein
LRDRRDGEGNSSRYALRSDPVEATGKGIGPIQHSLRNPCKLGARPLPNCISQIIASPLPAVQVQSARRSRLGLRPVPHHPQVTEPCQGRQFELCSIQVALYSQLRSSTQGCGFRFSSIVISDCAHTLLQARDKLKTLFGILDKQRIGRAEKRNPYAGAPHRRLMPGRPSASRGRVPIRQRPRGRFAAAAGPPGRPLAPSATVPAPPFADNSARGSVVATAPTPPG